MDSSTDNNDRRRFHRVPFDTDAELEYDGSLWTCDILDVSLKGVLLRPKQDLELPDSCAATVRIHLGDETTIEMRVTLVHREADQLGMRCDSIDLDSISHLRRLIELNLGDPQLAERDLTHLAAS